MTGRTKTLIIVAAAAALMAIAPCGALFGEESGAKSAAVVVLATQAEVSADYVRLGDIARIDTADDDLKKALAVLVLGESPGLSNGFVEIDILRVRLALRLSGFTAENVTVAGAGKTIIRAPGDNSAVSGELREELAGAQCGYDWNLHRILGPVRAYIAGRLGVEPADVDVDYDRSVKVPAAVREYLDKSVVIREVCGKTNELPVGSSVEIFVSLVVGEGPADEMKISRPTPLFTFNVTVLKKVVVASRALPARTVLAADMLTIERRRVSDANEIEASLARKDFAGRALKTAMRKGQPIGLEHLTVTTLVVRGQSLVCHTAFGPVSGRYTACESGQLNDIIRVLARVGARPKEIRARVVGAGEITTVDVPATLGPPSDRPVEIEKEPEPTPAQDPPTSRPFKRGSRNVRMPRPGDTATEKDADKPAESGGAGEEEKEGD